jgi:3-oxoadipate enol-lactonase
MLRAVATSRGLRPELLLGDEMARLSVPTLFVWGDADAFAPPSIGQELAARMPDAHFEVVPDAGHLPWVDRPDIVAASINGLLAQRKSP